MNNNFIKYYAMEQVIDYRKKLAEAISKNGLSNDEIMKDSAVKEFISNYTQKRIVEDRIKNTIAGITIKLVNIDLGEYNRNPNKVSVSYPIINKYKGHNLVESIYFSKEKDEVHINVVPFISASIII